MEPIETEASAEVQPGPVVKRLRAGGLPCQASLLFGEVPSAPEQPAAPSEVDVQLSVDVGSAHSTTDLLHKQLAALDKLYGVYKVEYFAVLEELHAKRCALHKDCQGDAPPSDKLILVPSLPSTDHASLSTPASLRQWLKRGAVTAPAPAPVPGVPHSTQTTSPAATPELQHSAQQASRPDSSHQPIQSASLTDTPPGPPAAPLLPPSSPAQTTNIPADTAQPALGTSPPAQHLPLERTRTQETGVSLASQGTCVASLDQWASGGAGKQSGHSSGRPLFGTPQSVNKSKLAVGSAGNSAAMDVELQGDAVAASAAPDVEMLAADAMVSPGASQQATGLMEGVGSQDLARPDGGSEAGDTQREVPATQVVHEDGLAGTLQQAGSGSQAAQRAVPGGAPQQQSGPGSAAAPASSQAAPEPPMTAPHAPIASTGNSASPSAASQAHSLARGQGIPSLAETTLPVPAASQPVCAMVSGEGASWPCAGPAAVGGATQELHAPDLLQREALAGAGSEAAPLKPQAPASLPSATAAAAAADVLVAASEASACAAAKALTGSHAPAARAEAVLQPAAIGGGASQMSDLDPLAGSAFRQSAPAKAHPPSHPGAQAASKPPPLVIGSSAAPRQAVKKPPRPFAGLGYGDADLGYGSDGDPAAFSDAEELLLALPTRAAGAPPPGPHTHMNGRAHGMPALQAPSSCPAAASAGPAAASAGLLPPPAPAAASAGLLSPAAPPDGEGAGLAPGAEGAAHASVLEGYVEVAGATLSGAASAEQVAAWRARFAAHLPQVLQLEALASATTEQELDAQGALACLAGRTGRYLIRRNTVLLGRCTEGKGEVDVDLECGGPAARASRRQAYLALRPDGRFELHNAGRREVHVDGQLVRQFESRTMGHLSMLEVGGLQLLLLVNTAAVERILRRTARVNAAA